MELNKIHSHCFRLIVAFAVDLYFHRSNDDKLRCFWYTACFKSFQTANASSLSDFKKHKKVSFENANDSHCSEIDKPLT